MNILIIIKVKILFLIEWSERAPQLCCILSLEWLTNFEQEVQSREHVFQCLFLGPHLTTHHSNIGVQSR